MAGQRKRIRPNAKYDMQKEYLEAAFNQFIREKEVQGRVKETLVAYRVAYERFCKYFGDSVEYCGDIAVGLFTDWTLAMRKEGLSTATINHNLGCMRAFIYWCMESGRKYIDEQFKIRLVKAQETPPKDYTIDEVKALLRKPKNKAKFTEWRNYAICNFVIGTGARLGTLVAIRMQDIDLKNGTVFYQHTKNKKLQIANLSPQLVKILNDYITMWRYDVEDDDYLFCNVSGEQLTKAGLTQSYREYTHSRGVNKTNIHGLRHTFAREWYLNGGDVVQLSKVLGHSTIVMSEHYMNIYANSNKEKFNLCNPLENLSRSGATKKVRRKTEDED